MSNPEPQDATLDNLSGKGYAVVKRDDDGGTIVGEFRTYDDVHIESGADHLSQKQVMEYSGTIYDSDDHFHRTIKVSIVQQTMGSRGNVFKFVSQNDAKEVMSSNKDLGDLFEEFIREAERVNQSGESSEFLDDLADFLGHDSPEEAVDRFKKLAGIDE